MATISIRLPNELLEEANRFAVELQVSRTEYIRQAIQTMNEQSAREIRRRRLFEASRKVREESMRINEEFAAVEDVPDAPDA